MRWMLAIFGLASCVMVTTPARALEPGKENLQAGFSVIWHLRKPTDRARVGVGVDALWSRIWHEQTDREHVAPSVGVGLHAFWTKPWVTTAVTARAGIQRPLLVGSAGYIELAGLEAVTGLQLSTDGTAGPIVGALANSYLTEVRIEAAHTQRGWQPARLVLGFRPLHNPVLSLGE